MAAASDKLLALAFADSELRVSRCDRSVRNGEEVVKSGNEWNYFFQITFGTAGVAARVITRYISYFARCE